MDYEKKYKEALERAKEKYTKCYSPTLLDYIFPELKENEGEKIIKWIIDDIRYNMNNVPLSSSEYKKQAEKAIAWLEKQGNKSINIDIESMVSSYKQRLKSQAGIRMENNPLVNMCLSAFRRGVENTLEELNLRTLEKQGEQEFIDSDTLIQQRVDTLADIDAKQSSADNVKPKVKNEIEVDSYCQKNCRGFQETGKCFADGECKAKREAESTDKVEQSSINEIEIPFGAKDSELQEATYYIPKGFHAEIDDDKVVIKKGEKPAAWSKKDEKMFEYALHMIEWYSGKNEDKSRFVSDWLKSLKQRIGG